MTEHINYYEYLKTEVWQRKTKIAKENAGHRCQICNIHENESTLDAHHRTYDNLGKESHSDLTVLCRKCHELYSQYDKLAKYGKTNYLLGRDAKLLNDITRDKKRISVFPTGFVDVDNILTGFYPSTLNMVTSVSGIGKTSFLLDIVRFLSYKSGCHILFFPLQHPTQYIAKTIQHGASYKEYENSSPQIIINNSVITDINQIMGIFLKTERNHKIDLIVIDGLETVHATDHQFKWNTKVTENIRHLKQFAQQSKCPILFSDALLNANEINKRVNKRPHIQDLNESIVTLCDTILALYRDEHYFQDVTDRPNILEVDIAKNRYGWSGCVDLFWNKQKMTMHDLSRASIEL